MKHLSLITLLLFATIGHSQEDDLLSKKFTFEEFKSVLTPYDAWTPFPPISDREAWAKADQEKLKAIKDSADQYLDFQWQHIPASVSLAFVRTGDREAYQNLSFGKRKVLGTLLLAEIFENKGRYLDQIIDGVWSICEESFWGIHAHLPGSVKGLADTEDPIVDLFAAETATYLAWVDYFLGDKLDAMTPQIRKRIQSETQHRIFGPLMTKHHGWMAANANGRPPNNWNPWICSNWINTALLLEKDPDKRAELVYKALDVLDEFLNPYPNDGGCDEGPSYWGAAAASLYDNISLLNLATNDAFSYVYANQKFQDMGRFIYRAQISEDYFLNFADADPQPKMAASMIYRYGVDIQDQDMIGFGAYYRDETADGTLGRFHYFRNFFELFIQDEFKSAPKKLPLPKDSWLPDLQVMVARDQDGSTDGYYVAAKGGHNDESHNHNDIGNYVVFYNGEPLIIDVGRGTYTRKTFSSQRYEIWYNCSDYHNLPTIGDVTQSPGKDFRAQRVEYDKSDKSATFSLDISRAYDDNQTILRWARQIQFDRASGVQIKDEFRLRENRSITEHIMTCYPAYIREPGTLVIPFQPEGQEVTPFHLNYDPTMYSPTIEKVKLEAVEDKGIEQKWGDRIYRINLKSNAELRNGAFAIELKKG